jgi:SnoaL-like domain
MKYLFNAQKITFGKAMVTLLSAVALIVPIAQSVSAQQPTPVTAQSASDRASIIDAINAVGMWADRKDFVKLRSLFADTVAMDYTSLAGGSPVTVKADDLMKGWEAGLKPFRTQHMIASHLVTINGNTAESLSNVHAIHYVPNELGISNWQVYGYYEHKFVRTSAGWKVTALKINKTMADGNAALSGLAATAGVQK